MIVEPLNDRACLGKLTALAADGVRRSEVRDLAARFDTTRSLARWIRALPQRNDDGNLDEGPRVACDVSQRARLIAADPNCVERSLLYLAASEAIDPAPVRQLATIDTVLGRHTFPVEAGQPVILDPALPRNVLMAGLFRIQRAETARPRNARIAVEPMELLMWLADLAEEAASVTDGEVGRQRVHRGRRTFEAVLQGEPVTRADRDAALYTLRKAAPSASLFGPEGVIGWKMARSALARLLTRLVPRVRNAHINWERVGYWTGKAAATYTGFGSLYDPVYQAVGQSISHRPSAAPRPSRPAKPPAPKPKRRRRVVRVEVPRVLVEAIQQGARVERVEPPPSSPARPERAPTTHPKPADDGVPASELE